MEIQRAVTEDLPGIQRLYRTLFREMAGLQPGYWREAGQSAEFLCQMMEGADSLVLVALEGVRCVGFAVAQEQQAPPYDPVVPRRYAYLMDLAVDPGCRGQGTGSALLEAVKEWARSRGLRDLELNVLEENAGAARLYRREGFRPVMQTMRCSLDGGDAT